MKKILALIMAVGMMLSLAACGGEEASTEAANDRPDTMAYALLTDFEKRVENGESLEEIANGLLENDKILFAGMAMMVEEGLLNGFSNEEITGFEEGYMFAPMIGSIPFVGYVFDVESEEAAKTFIEKLEASANLSWNVCVTADEMVTGNVGDKVFFVMSPKTMEE